MCSPARCSRCSKTTWRGCGQHIDAVMGHLPDAQRCGCPPVEKRTLLQRLIGR